MAVLHRRFDLLGCADETFGRFLAELVHPLVREDADEAARLTRWCNESLREDGWELVTAKHLRGRPIVAAQRRAAYLHPATALDLDRYPRLSDPVVFAEHLRRIEQSVEFDPPAAIGAAKELVETTCRVILRDYDPGLADKRMDMPELYRAVADALDLKAEAVPDSVTGSKAAQQTLRTLVTTIQSLTELRNALGIGHGRDRRSPALARHARLAFHAAVTVTDFLLATWDARRAAESTVTTRDR